MQAILFGVFDFVAKNRWVQWIIIGLLIVGTLGLYLAWRDGSVRKRVKLEQEVETQKERERVIATAQEEVDNVQDAKDAALAAPDSLPEFVSADELRDKAPAIAKVILRNRSGDQRGS
jgi:type VI protein secretion system component VasK